MGTCTECGESKTAVIEALVPTYEWGEAVLLKMPLVDVQVEINKDSTGYWIEFQCASMNQTQFSAFFVHSTTDWGVDRTIIANQLSIILSNYDKMWQEGTRACVSMEGYGRTWTVVMEMDESKGTLMRLKVNLLKEFNAVTGLEMTE